MPLLNGLIRDGENPNKILLPSRNHSWIFARNFISHPIMLGSVIPSSSFLINRLLRRINWDKARTIVEYGPGTGCFTIEILKRLHRDGTLIAIDMNTEFVHYLRKTIPDARLKLFEGSAADVAGFLSEADVTSADYVISGIPFSMIPHTAQKEILNSTASVLTTDGRLLVYQFSKAILTPLQKSFKRVEMDFELLNILPARLFYCQK